MFNSSVVVNKAEVLLFSLDEIRFKKWGSMKFNVLFSRKFNDVRIRNVIRY